MASNGLLKEDRDGAGEQSNCRPVTDENNVALLLIVRNATILEDNVASFSSHASRNLQCDNVPLSGQVALARDNRAQEASQ